MTALTLIRRLPGIHLVRKMYEGHLRRRAHRQALQEYYASEKDFLAAGGGDRFSKYSRYPCLTDKHANLSYERHYFYHPAWAARVLQETAPARHVDISSIFGFAGILSAFIPTTYYEYQPPSVQLTGLTTARIDLCAIDLPANSVASLSCLHVLEHVGLGRYGDPLDPDGDLVAAKELVRVLAPGGNLLFASPTAADCRLEFNANRIYTYAQVIAMFQPLELVEFSLIPDSETQGGLIRHAPPEALSTQKHACGCFHFRKAPALASPLPPASPSP